MQKDSSERKTYRKSPGRHYGYTDEPLYAQRERGQDGQRDTSTQSESWPSQVMSASRPNTALVQRPDPRRTRQLLRQNILAGKSTRPIAENDTLLETQEGEKRTRHLPYYEEMDGNTLTRRRYVHDDVHPHLPSTQELMEEEEEPDEWEDFEESDSATGYEDTFDAPMEYPEGRPKRASVLSPAPRLRQTRARRPEHQVDDEEAYENDEKPPVRRKRRKRKLSRRGLLLGAGAVALGGVGVAAYELGPKIPQAVGNVGSTIEHQLQDAFNNGVAQGAANVRKEFVTALDNLEGVSLESAMGAARLTRVAYDVFVSPLIKFGSTITGDFLKGMLGAVKTARGWLAGAFQDNVTLQAVQKVLESWVGQVSSMPKQLDAITQTDLDGAQAYLRSLQRKLDEEKAKLNNAQVTPSPAPKFPARHG